MGRVSRWYLLWSGTFLGWLMYLTRGVGVIRSWSRGRRLLLRVVLLVHLLLWDVSWARAAWMLRCQRGVVRPWWRRNVAVGRISTSSPASSRELHVGANRSEWLAERWRVEWSVTLVVWLSPILVMTCRAAVSRMLVAWRAVRGSVYVSFVVRGIGVHFLW